MCRQGRKFPVSWKDGSIWEDFRGHLERVGRNFLITSLISGRAGCIFTTRGHLKDESCTLTVDTNAWLEVSMIEWKCFIIAFLSVYVVSTITNKREYMYNLNMARTYRKYSGS